MHRGRSDRCATWARHIADATAHIVQRSCRERDETKFAPGILHLTAGGATSWCGFAEAILDQTMDRQSLHRSRPTIHPIASSEYPRPATRPKNSRLAGERLRERFGIALPEWHEGLALCLQDEPLTAAESEFGMQSVDVGCCDDRLRRAHNVGGMMQTSSTPWVSAQATFSRYQA